MVCILTKDFDAHCATTCPSFYGENPVRIVARVMAWRFEGEKVRYCDNSPLKKWA